LRSAPSLRRALGSILPGGHILKALITGIGGFAGTHLAQYLLENSNWEVHGLDLVEGRAAPYRSQLQLHVSDILMDLRALTDLFHAIRPDYVFHLAAQAFVPTSWESPWHTLENNIRGQLNVLLAAIALETLPRILVVGSADEYGIVYPSELPIRETNTLRPNSPYSVSKVAQDMLGYQYHASHGLPVVRVRPFNHIGPGQSPVFVASAFAKQIAEAEVGLQEPIVRVGNLDARRDISDVRDMVRAYHLAITMGEPGEVYNLGSERSVSIRQVLDELISLSKARLTVELDPARLRPSDVPDIVADCSKFHSLTGWRVEIPLRQSLHDILDYWRSNIKP